MVRNAVVALVLGMGVVLASACNPPNIAGDPLKGTTTGEAFEGVQCSAVRPQTEPDLMAWDPGSRSNLNRLRRQGVVAVRYEAKGCNVELELLSNCIGTIGKYEYSPYSANEHKVAHNASELFAQLPVGAARLGGSVKGNRALRTDYMMAGQYALPAGTEFKAADLRGPDCARATHVVSAVYVGAFAMGAGETRSIEASATLLGAGAGGKSNADVEVIGDEGNAEACTSSQKDGKESEQCAVPLRIGLLALVPVASPPSQAAAAPPLAPVPAQGDLVVSSLDPSGAFLNVNSRPASTVYLDGRLLGPTPRIHVGVSPGTHTLAFVDADGVLKKSVSVSLAPGETKALSAQLTGDTTTKKH